MRETVLETAYEDPESSDPLPEPDPYITTDGPILSTRFKDPEGTWLDDYIADGGYKAAKKALRMKRETVIEKVLNANLRGLGGAGFPAGRKWSFIPKDSEKPIYLVANADESCSPSCCCKIVMCWFSTSLLTISTSIRCVRLKKPCALFTVVFYWSATTAGS